MVSYDHFRHALLTQLRRAESEGLTDVAVTSVEFGKSFGKGGNGGLNMETCCQAMKDEMKPGDVVEQERDSGVGLVIRYRLPRAEQGQP